MLLNDGQRLAATNSSVMLNVRWISLLPCHASRPRAALHPHAHTLHPTPTATKRPTALGFRDLSPVFLNNISPEEP